jgi:hypothetical protein
MTINSLGTISNTVSTLYNSATVQNTTTAPLPSQSATIQGMPSDALALGGKSLIVGLNVSSQILSARRSEIPSEHVKFHSGSSMMTTARNSAIASGAVSIAKNTYDYIGGGVTGTRAGGNITADVIGGIGSGIAASTISNLATKAIGSSMGAGIVGLTIGAVTFAGIDILYRNSGAFQTVSDKATSIIEALMNKVNPPGGW